MILWGGRFNGKIDPNAWIFNASIHFDQRLALQEIRCSQAWAKALEKAGVIDSAEWIKIKAGLDEVLNEFKSRSFTFSESDEDIHTAVERRLSELIGSIAGKLNTGRSRNDQVATDLRLWLLDHIPRLDDAIVVLQSALIGRAEADIRVIMPGYTHLQRAQPILLSHWWLSHFWPLQRDRIRLSELANRTASLPLGSGALAGTPIQVDRIALAKELGFRQPTPNSLDAVSDRDFAAELLFCTTLCGVHLSKMAEAVVLFSSAEFGFFEIPDAYATGSSLMPQKKNPDLFELVRGKAGTLLGYLTGLITTLKGLPSTYDKDLQEDKVPVFNAYDTLITILPIMAKALLALKINPDRMYAGIDANMMATDLADVLVEKGIPFREAHALIGKAVKFASEHGKTIGSLSEAEFQKISTVFNHDVYGKFDPMSSIYRRNAIGGTAPEAVLIQIQAAREAINMIL